MPKFVKNAMNQIMFPMVDKIDFATVESGITASDFNSAATKKYFGVNHGVSDAFTSGTISKATTLVHSGIFQQTLKAAECNYDYIIYRFSHPSCADQILIFQTDEIDPSDTYSAAAAGASRALLNQSRISDAQSYLAAMSGVLSDVYSNLTAGVLVGASGLSDIGSNVWAHTTGAAVSSRVLLNLSRISDVYSLVSDLSSDLRSYLVGLSAVASDAHSAAAQANSRALVIQSTASDILSQLMLVASNVSDVDSALTSQFTAGHPLNASDMSDIRSAIAAYQGMTASDISDLRSAITAGFTISASDMSDIASRVWATTAGAAVASRVLLNLSLISDVYSLATLIASNVSDVESQLDLTASLVSDIDSALTSQFTAGHPLTASDISDLRSAIAAVTASVGASDISDIASAVWANTLGAAVSSRVLLNLSRISDVYSLALLIASNVSDVESQIDLNASMISDVQSALDSQFVWTSNMLSDMLSDLGSKIGNVSVTLTASDISDIASATAAAITTVGPSDVSNIASAVYDILVSNLSDILSAAQQTNSRVLVVQSHASNIYSLLSDVDSNLQSRIPKAVATNSQLSDLMSDIRSYLVGMSGAISDVDSALTSQYTAGHPLTASDISDLRSAITAGGVSASGISDIASAVYALVVSQLSDILSAAQQTNSRALVVQSQTSDIYSLLSDVQSDFQSRVPKAVATNSQLSDLASDLKSYLAGLSGAISDVESQIDLNASMISDIDSAMTSEFTYISDVLSDISSDLGIMSGVQSDIYSNLQAGVAVGVSSLSDLYSMIWDTTEAELAAVPAAAAGYGDKLNWLFALARNKRTTNSAVENLRNDADGDNIASAAVSDDGTTFTRGEWA